MTRGRLVVHAHFYQPFRVDPFTDRIPDDASAAPLERSQWERIALGADVELHIRRPLTRTQQKGIDRLVTIARELLEEERP